MQHLNKTASKTMDKILALNTNKIDNTNGAFMPLHISHLFVTDKGPVFSLAHYYEQNGDLMSDPRMEFLCIQTEKHGNWYYPMIFEQHGFPATYQISLFQDENLTWKESPKLNKDHAKFANFWLKNIKQQQRL